MIRTGILYVPEIDADASQELRRLLREIGAIIILEDQRASNRNLLADTLSRWCDEEELDLVLTIGGTLPAPGPSAEECVPEATLSILDRLAPALSEAMRAEVSVEHALALLDRGVAGIRSRTLIINLPAGEAAPLFLAAIAEVLPEYVAHLRGDANASRQLVSTPSESQAISHTAPSNSSLNAEEFAAFLQRTKPNA